MPFNFNKPIYFVCLIMSITIILTAHYQPFRCQSPEEKASKHFHIADRAYGKGKTRKALKHLKLAIELDNKEKKYVLYIARIYHELGKYDDAIFWIDKMRKRIEDDDPFLAIKLMNWVGGYAISLDRNKAAIKLFEGAVKKMNTYGFQDSLFLTSLYNNWGVAELFDQGDESPCHEELLGYCGKILISDVRRAQKRFSTANDYAPDNCNRMSRWNQALTDKILSIPKDTLKKYRSYIPVSWVDSIVIAKEDTLCPAPPPELIPDNDIKVEKAILSYFEEYDELVFVLDISGSMRAKVAPGKKTSRFQLMQATIIEQIQAADSTQKIGLITVGGECYYSPHAQIPAGVKNRDLLISKIKGMYPDGGTPLYESLNNSTSLFTQEQNKKLIFLASDGIESCETNFSVCNLAGELCDAGIRVDVMSLLLDERSNYNAYGLYECISNACASPVIHVDKKAEFNTMEQFIPPGYCSFWVHKEDLKSGEFKEQVSCSLHDILASGEQTN